MTQQDIRKQSCPQKDNIENIKKDIEEISHLVKGNSKPGLAVQVPLLSQLVSELNQVVSELKTTVSGILRFIDDLKIREQIEHEEDDKNNYRKSRKKEAFYKTFGAVIAFVTLIFFLYFGFHGFNKKIDSTKTGRGNSEDC